jgi:hypothetical protein
MRDGKFVEEFLNPVEFLEVSDDVTLKANETIVIANLPTDAGEVAITLPKVCDAKGREVAVYVQGTAAEDCTVNVADQADGRVTIDDDMGAPGDYGVYRCDGEAWVQIAAKKTAAPTGD